MTKLIKFPKANLAEIVFQIRLLTGAIDKGWNLDTQVVVLGLTQKRCGSTSKQHSFAWSRLCFQARGCNYMGKHIVWAIGWWNQVGEPGAAGTPQQLLYTPCKY